jgi:subtilisin
MCRVDEVIKFSLDQFGYSQVLTVLKEEPANKEAIPLGAQPLDAGQRSGFYLKELPNLAKTTLQDVVGRISRAFSPASPQGSEALHAAILALSRPKRSRRTEEPSKLSVRAPASKYFRRLGVEWGYVDPGGLSQLSLRPDVSEILHTAPLSTIDPVDVRVGRPGRARLTWGLRKLRIPDLWEKPLSLTGRGVRVGHLDTGIDASHRAFKGRQITFAEFDLEGNEVKGSKPHDSARHGTHTAGTICGGEVSGLKIGVAPGVELFSAMVLEGGTLARVLAGIEWCLENNVHILNMSLGIPGYTKSYETIFMRVLQSGVLPVVSIGNNGVGTSCSPGNYPGILSVGASDRRDQVPDFSSSIVFNRDEEPFEPNIVAPGLDVLSAKPAGGLLSMYGTSYAAPHVTGCVALLLEHRPNLKGNRPGLAQVVSAIQLTCAPTKHGPVLRGGNGRIDPVKAIQVIEML